MLFDPLVEHTVEEVKALDPKPQHILEIMSYYNNNFQAFDQSKRQAVKSNLLTLQEIVGKEQLAAYVNQNYPKPVKDS